MHNISVVQHNFRCATKWFSPTYTRVYCFSILFPFRLLQTSEQSTLCYAQGPCLNSPQYCYMSFSALRAVSPQEGTSWDAQWSPALDKIAAEPVRDEPRVSEMVSVGTKCTPLLRQRLAGSVGSQPAPSLFLLQVHPGWTSHVSPGTGFASQVFVGKIAVQVEGHGLFKIKSPPCLTFIFFY